MSAAPKDDLTAVLDAFAAECCGALAADRGNAVAPSFVAERAHAGTDQDPTELVAVIGFSGDVVRGALGLTATLDTVAKTHPATLAGEATTPKQLEDWLGEMSNQLLGRLKARLRGYGAPIWMSTPLVLRGVSVQIGSRHEQVRRYLLRDPHGAVFTVWLDLEIEPGFTFPAEVPDTGPRPGDVVMF